MRFIFFHTKTYLKRLVVVLTVKTSAAKTVHKMPRVGFRIFHINDWLLLWLRKESYS